MPEMSEDPGSFRDPAGSIYHMKGRVFRTVSAKVIEDFRAVVETGLLEDLVDKGLLVGWTEVGDRSLWPEDAPSVETVLEHPRLPFISYPYEWSFGALKAAALTHLDVHLKALALGVTLVDASAYNVQFLRGKPVFIDHLSFRPYEEGEFWLGHKQFCDQFLVPLLLRSTLGIPHNAWYRGAQEGIPGTALASILPWYVRWRPRMATHMTLPAFFERRQTAGRAGVKNNLKAGRRFSKTAMAGMLNTLRKWIGGLQAKGTTGTTWSAYADNTSYSESETAKKREFITRFVERLRPKSLWDIGCNTGAYAEVALNAGAGSIIGFEYDQGALEASYQRASDKSLDFLPLYMDMANPSPSQGWGERERQGLSQRAAADGMIALALLHHLVIGRNVQLAEAVSWLIDIAPIGVIEFIPKPDPMVQEMLKLRKDIFDDYTFDNFTEAVSKKARIAETQTITGTGRELVLFDRT